MNYYTIPADFKKETIDRYTALHKKYDDSRVSSTYGNITLENSIGSGRNLPGLPQVDLSSLSDYITYSRLNNIDFCYTLNASCFQNREFTEEGIKEIQELLTSLHGAGVRTLIISLPPLFEIIKSMDLDFRIKASAFMQIDSPNKALFIKKLGYDRIVTDEGINRDFATLKSIVGAVGDEVEVIVNTACHQDCHYQTFHNDQVSLNSMEKDNEVACHFYPLRCLARLYSDVTEIFKVSWIRPEDIRFYSAIGIKHFKLQGRQNAMDGDPVKTVEYYFKQQFDGNLMDLLLMFKENTFINIDIDNKKLEGFIRPFVEKKNFCIHDCTQCDYCESFAKKHLDYEGLQKQFSSERQIFLDKDLFKNLL